jgi:hypothetical protein
VAAYLSRSEGIRAAEKAIKEEKFAHATAVYEKLAKYTRNDEYIFSRLMMLYRKQKMYRKELQTINTAIRQITEAFYAKGQKLFAKKPLVKRMSNALSKSLGLMNAKGKPLYEPPPVAQWKKRREIVLKKLHKSKRLA